MTMARRLGAAVTALLLTALTATNSGGVEADLRKVERVYLDDVWPSPYEDERFSELYIRALTRHHAPVKDLHPSHFAIVDANKRVKTEDLEVKSLSEMHRGVTCVIAMDVSRTMKGDAFDRAKAAAIEFMKFVESRDKVAVVTFAGEENVVAPFTASRADAKLQLESLAVEDQSLNTVLYDAIHRSVELIREGHDLPRRAFVIVFSDGNDTGSQRSLEQVIDEAGGNEVRPPVLIFTIGYARFGGEGLEILKQISEQTSAVYRPATSTLLISSFFNEVWNQMMRSYVVRYPADMNGELHKVEIEIEGLTDSKTVRYPNISGPIWLYLGVAVLVVLVALVSLLIARGRSGGRLVFENGLPAGEVHVLRKSRTTIGALPDNDIVIPSVAVSKYHLNIYRRGSQLEIEDLNSLNGTYVNGTRVQTSPLQPDDRIRIADVDLVYRR
jgi:VWFA-related protein